MFEAVNFAAFLGDPKKTQIIARRIHDEAVRLKVKEVAIVECGTAFRVMKYMTRIPSLPGRRVRGADRPLPAGRPHPPRPLEVCRARSPTTIRARSRATAA